MPRFISLIELVHQVHIRTENKMAYSCTYCLKNFISENRRVSHLRTHTEEKPFHCTQCPKAFSNGGDLKKHLRTHSGEKPFPCNQCPKAVSYTHHKLPTTPYF